jgi:crotonobetainyl-CoA:carnitine CoA-transferase CaiB-like acyl-CoA transferase
MAGEVADQAGNNHPTSIPSGLYPSSDGQILIAAAGDRLWERFCKAAGQDHWLRDPRYRSGAGRLAHRDELNEEIAELTRTRTSQHWFDLFGEAGVPCGPVNTIDKVFADKQVQHVGMTVETEHPTLGKLAMVAQPYNIGGHRKYIRNPPPGLGQQTDEILRSLNYSDEQIADLRRRDLI